MSHLSDSTPVVSDHGNEQVGFDSNEHALPKGSFYSRFFIGSYLAIGIGLWSETAAFGYAAPVLGIINADIGPDPRYVWISLVYNVVLGVMFLIVGRLSDIFGRRYFMIGGAALGCIGAIICATAKSVPVLICGNVSLGAASAAQISFSYVQADLVPMKYRYISSAGIYAFSIPGSGFGPAVAYAFITRYSVGWRGIYWFILAIDGLDLLLWALLYFPPTFHQKHKRDIDSKMYWIKRFDYVGTFLFASGLIVFLLGLSWGGSIYPWKSAAVISAIALRSLILVLFVLWEIFAPIKEPVLPMHIFENGNWTAAVVLLGLGAGVYYAFAIVWPQQAAVLYAKPGDQMYTGYLSCLIGVGFITGQVLAGLLARSIGKMRIQCMVAFFVGAVFFACAATVNPGNKSTQIALIFLGCCFIGWNESVCLTNTTILVQNQQEIGIAGGAAGSLRSVISAVLTAIYVSVFTNRITETISTEVPAALVAAGLPKSSIPGFLAAFTSGTAETLGAVPGINGSIITAGTRAYKVASADAYRTVYLVTIAFSGLGVLLTWFAPNTEKYMTSNIAATLHQTDADPALNEKIDDFSEKPVQSIVA